MRQEGVERSTHFGVSASGLNEASFREALFYELPRLEIIARRVAREFSGNLQDAEDVLHSTLDRAITKWETYDPMKGKITTWFATIARNLAKDSFRKMTTQKKFDPYAVSDAASGAVSTDPYVGRFEVDALTTYRDAGSAAQKAVDEVLNEKEREVFGYVLADLTYGEIAAKMHIPLGTVKSCVRTARTKLQHRLSQSRITSESIFAQL